MTRYSQNFGLTFPDDFPVDDLEVAHAKVTAAAHPSAVWREWASGVNGVMYRFLGADADAERWILSVATSESPPMDERLKQEIWAFEFYANALSTLECLAYACSSMGEIVDPSAFGVTRNPRGVTFTSTAKGFATTFPADNLGSTLSAVDGSQEMIDVREIRNVLSHRAAPGRMFSEALTSTLSSGSSSARGTTIWLGRELSASALADVRVWLGKQVAVLVAAARTFADDHF